MLRPMRLAIEGPIRLRATIERWPLTVPFHITGHTWEALDVLLVTLEQDGCFGRGEAAGVYYRHETPASMLAQIEAIRPAIEAGIARDALLRALPLGGARNAVDCALWELEAKIARQPVSEMLGVEEPRPLVTTFTCGADTPARMACAASNYIHARAIKLKLTGADMDKDRVIAVRAARPDVWLGVDANQGFTRPLLDHLLPTLVQAQVSLIEQPFPVGQDSFLDGLDSPIAIAADESIQGIADLRREAGRYDAVNIKLDKCGGLTEALAMLTVANEMGLDVLIGNMIGTSLAMAPAFLAGQGCAIVDLDGPLFLTKDRVNAVRYNNGLLMCSQEVWGGAV